MLALCLFSNVEQPKPLVPNKVSGMVTIALSTELGGIVIRGLLWDGTHVSSFHVPEEDGLIGWMVIS